MLSVGLQILCRVIYIFFYITVRSFDYTMLGVYLLLCLLAIKFSFGINKVHAI